MVIGSSQRRKMKLKDFILVAVSFLALVRVTGCVRRGRMLLQIFHHCNICVRQFVIQLFKNSFSTKKEIYDNKIFGIIIKGANPERCSRYRGAGLEQRLRPTENLRRQLNCISMYRLFCSFFLLSQLGSRFIVLCCYN